MKTIPAFFLFALILLEGYVVLSSELLAIRQTIPFTGSGTDTVSIIIAAVLMPLAFGYQAGGRFKPGFNANGQYQSIRQKLIRNIMISMVILLLGLSYPLIKLFFEGLIYNGITNRLLLVTLYSALFLVTPVYFLGQTIPLVSNYFGRARLAQITGKILFISTMGSFLGAVFSTLVLMAFIGVHNTVTLNFVILAALVIGLNKKKLSETAIIAIGIAACAAYLNSGAMIRGYGIVENNQYNAIQIVEIERDNGDIERNMILNNNGSSMYSDQGRKHDYVEFIESKIIDTIPQNAAPMDILVIGAGAFTIGFEDAHNQYDYLDIDKSLKRIAEKHILKSPLLDNKTFHPTPARAFLSGTDKQYDIIILDAYLGNLTFPEHLITHDFFALVKSHIKDGGVLAANFITSPNYTTKFSRNLDDTFRSVFKNSARHAVDNDSNNANEKQQTIWDKSGHSVNIAYMFKNHKNADKINIYTDNMNRVFYDKHQ